MKPTSKKVLSKVADLPKREAKLGRYGVHQVPRYVSRCDIDDPAGATHGWQVRYPGKSNKFFSDGTTGGTVRTRASGSLARAVAYLGECLKKDPRPADRPSKHPDGTPVGVSLTRRRAKDRNVEELFVRVTVSKPSRRTKVLYVGTSNTATRARVAEKLREGLALREKMMAGRV